MDQSHQGPPVPPPLLVSQWLKKFYCPMTVPGIAPGKVLLHVAAVAARWGADHELEACCADIHTVYGKDQADWLRSLRRPQPPSLKEQALEELAKWREVIGAPQLDTIRRALEQLDD